MIQSGVYTGKNVAMRVFRANDKMSAKEPMSLIRAQGWDPFPVFGQKAIPRSVLMLGTIRRL